MKYPKVKPKEMDFKIFLDFLNNKEKETEENIKNTETIISKGGE